MSRELHGGGRWPGLWKLSPAKGRVPTPSAEVVAAAPLLRALAGALDGQAPPCHGHAEVWTSEDEADVLVAAEGCASCPARRECAAYADAIAATCGVWAGCERKPQDRRRRTSTDTERTSA